jgi:hypothetical protein
LHIIILWRIDPLLGKDFETNNGTAAVAVQRCGKDATIKLLLDKQVPAATVTHSKGETGWCLRGPRLEVIKMRATSHLRSAREAVKIEPECEKLKKLHC